MCAAGLSGSTADDVAKEVAIFRAHKAAPIVVADEDQSAVLGALAVLPVPAVDPRLGFILSTMAGHLFGYEAALAIDAQARPMREARSAIEQAAAHPQMVVKRRSCRSSPRSNEQRLRSSTCSAPVSSTAIWSVDGEQGRIASAVALGSSPLEAYQIEYGKVGTPAVVLNDLAAALTLGIEELTRPIDAIKHQAKTVTVGISRSDETSSTLRSVGLWSMRGLPAAACPTPRCAPSLTSTRRSTTCSVPPAIASRAWTLTATARPRLWSSTERHQP